MTRPISPTFSESSGREVSRGPSLGIGFFEQILRNECLAFHYIWNITFVLVSSIAENVELVSFVFVLESAICILLRKRSCFEE